MKPSKILTLALALTMALFALCGCYFLPEEEELLEAPVVKATDVSYTTTTAELKDLTRQVLTPGTISSGTEYNARFTERGGNIKEKYVSAGDVV